MGIRYSGELASDKMTPPKGPPIASLVIRTYNESRHLGALLDAVAKQRNSSDRSIEVLVVDSGSQDGSDTIALESGAKLIRIAKSQFTFGRSLNMGCEQAKGEFLILVSGHCIPKDDRWLEELLKPFSDPSVAITYGRQIGDDTSKFSESRVFEKYYPESSSSQGPYFCNNANAAVRRSIWRRFRYDEQLPGLEDIELGRRVVIAGFRIIYTPEAIVHHIHDESWPQVRRRFEREAIALRHIHPELHMSAIGAVLCFLSAVCKDIAAMIRDAKPLETMSQIVLFRFNQFYGSWIGNRPHRDISRHEMVRYFFPS